MIFPYELTDSSTALEKKIVNTPPNSKVWYSLLLVMSALSDVRARVNYPIKITSGYRSDALNQVVGGAPNSFHIKGRAVDIKLRSLDAYKEVAKLWKQAVEKLGFTYTIIWEHPSYSGFPKWMHLQINDYDDEENREFTIK